MAKSITKKLLEIRLIKRGNTLKLKGFIWDKKKGGKGFEVPLLKIDKKLLKDDFKV